MFPLRAASVIHGTETSVLSTILHEVYKQGLVAESVKYWAMSRLAYTESAIPDF